MLHSRGAWSSKHGGIVFAILSSEECLYHLEIILIWIAINTLHYHHYQACWDRHPRLIILMKQSTVSSVLQSTLHHPHFQHLQATEWGRSLIYHKTPKYYFCQILKVPKVLLGNTGPGSFFPHSYDS